MKSTNERIKPNGCGEQTGWDYYEDQVREKFESYVVRKNYDLDMLPHGMFYKDEKTEDAWRLYHHGHVAGRTFKVISDD